jgi:protein-S-isoprenylcysteine O-methyltransferase Ste14
MGKLKHILNILLGIILYAALFAGVRYVNGLLPGLYLWEQLKASVTVWGYVIRWADIVYFAVGLIVFVHAMTGLSGISRQNHTAQDMETRKPTRLLTDGYYAKVRHPMYGVFMLMVLGIFFPSRSIYGLVIIALIVLLQGLNGRMEEKHELEPLFGNAYQDYKKEVPVRYLTPAMKVYFGICTVITVLGLIWM